MKNILIFVIGLILLGAAFSSYDATAIHPASPFRTGASIINKSGASIGFPAIGNLDLAPKAGQSVTVPDGTKICLDGGVCALYLDKQGGTISAAPVVAFYKIGTAIIAPNGPALAHLNFDSQIVDTDNAVVTPTTDWKFVAPKSGNYLIIVNVGGADRAWGNASSQTLIFYKNGVKFSEGNTGVYPMIAWTPGVNSAGIIPLATGDTASVYLSQWSGGDLTLNNADRNWIAISLL